MERVYGYVWSFSYISIGEEALMLGEEVQGAVWVPVLVRMKKMVDVLNNFVLQNHMWNLLLAM